MDIPVPSSAGTLTTDASQLSSFHRYCLALRCHLTFLIIHLWDVFLRDSRYRTMPSHFASIQHWRAKKAPELSVESVVTFILPLPLHRPVPPVCQGMASRAPLENSQSTWDPTNSCNYKAHICKCPHPMLSSLPPKNSCSHSSEDSNFQEWIIINWKTLLWFSYPQNAQLLHSSHRYRSMIHR